MQKVGRNTKNCFTNMKFQSHAMSNEQKIIPKKVKYSIGRAGKGNFSVFSSENCVEHQDFLIESGAIYVIKDKRTFANLDENFSGKIRNANKTHSLIIGNWVVEFFAKKSNEKLKKILL